MHLTKAPFPPFLYVYSFVLHVLQNIVIVFVGIFFRAFLPDMISVAKCLVNTRLNMRKLSLDRWGVNLSRLCRSWWSVIDQDRFSLFDNPIFKARCKLSSVAYIMSHPSSQLFYPRNIICVHPKLHPDTLWFGFHVTLRMRTSCSITAEEKEEEEEWRREEKKKKR